MRILKVATNSFLLGLLLSCATTIWWEHTPKFKGVDPRLAPMVDDWKSMANLYGIKFKNKLTMGITAINSYPIVGECTKSPIFREITVDSEYWERSSNIKRTITVYHELGHCVCGREHGYGAKGRYDEGELISSNRDGYFSDSCPVSLMYPVVVEESCYISHYSEYMDDLFQNCKPY